MSCAPDPSSAYACDRYCDSSDYRSNDDSDQTVAAQIRYAFEDLFYQYNVRAAHHCFAHPSRLVPVVMSSMTHAHMDVAGYEDSVLLCVRRSPQCSTAMR